MRLALPAAIAWIVALSALLSGAHVLGAALCLLCATVCCGVVVARRRGGVLALVAVAAACGVGVCVTAALAEPVRRPPVLVEAAEQGHLVDAVVVLDSALAPSSGGKLRATATLRELDARAVNVPVAVFTSPETTAAPHLGSTVTMRARVLLTDPGDSASALLFSDEELVQTEDPPAYLAWAGTMRERFVALCAQLPGDGGRLLPGLAVGDTTAVSSDLDGAMKQSSLSHLTAVSGANCAIVVAAAMAVLARLGVARWMRTVGALALLGAFVVLVTPQASVVRAAVMASIALIVHARGRPAGGLSVLSVTVIGLLIADPWLALDAGFALSVLATAGLLVLARPLANAIARVLPRLVANLVSLPLAAQLACQPVLILLSSTLPVYGVAANILAAPAAPLGTVAGLIACIVGTAHPGAAFVLAWIGFVPAAWIAGVANVTSGLPAANLPWLPGVPGALLIGAAAAALAALTMSNRLRRHRVGALLAVALLLGTGGYGGILGGAAIADALRRPATWTVAACDVGQGDAVLVRGGGAVLLVDTGPDPKPLGDCLAELGIQRIDLLVLTHYDLDHRGGVAAVYGRTAEAFVQTPHDDAGAEIVSDLEQAGARVTIARAGMSGAVGGIRYDVLWPADPHLDGNAGSVTLSVHVDGLSVLLLGDLGQDAQGRLLRRHTLDGRYDIVKVSHHGSADQEPALYETVAASIALVSVGADNDYGHPTGAALEMLKRAGSRVFRTDEQGMIMLWSEPTGIGAWTAKSAQPEPAVSPSG
ncbi:competence protein ComEC [Paramicrobacterium humi]|uniref:Competence protein ComEC n=1 Tax=Paramicrobacterium humi TaxID=640635 RepID=A0A1H4QC69_9MICO|nr:ComEC/Rec2 family competence protein [Microbacterium humi]SEC17236.1 competence protein ComEC [Microbacterium humi]